MIVYIYDGSFEGLLTCIYEAFFSKENPIDIVSESGLQHSFINTYKYISTDDIKSDKVYNAVRSKISRQALENAYYVFLSENIEAGRLVLEYLRLGFKVKDKIDNYLANDSVLKVNKISQRVGFEKHRMMGFVRFSHLDGDLYYAPIEPDNNITVLLAPHFAERLADQNWIIHDVRRQIAAVYNKKSWILVNAPENFNPRISKEEEEYRKLWKEFFHSIAIEERYNPMLQRNLMPKRYWKYITEKN